MINLNILFCLQVLIYLRVQELSSQLYRYCIRNNFAVLAALSLISAANTDCVGRMQALLPDESSNMATTRWLIGAKRFASRVVAELPCEK